jgi:lambda family phage minor tail protein L
MAVPFSDLQQVAPSAIIELFQLELNAAQHGVNQTYYFHAGANLDGNNDIVWDGQAYLRFPIEATEFEYNGQGQLPRPKLRVSNILGTITALLLTLPSGLEGAKVTRIRTLARYIDAVNFPGGVNPLGTPDPTAEFPREIYYVDRKSLETRDVVEFELAAAFDLVGVRAPKRQCVSNICQWVYRGAECGYTGNAYFNANDQPVATLAQDVCGKRLSSCEARFEQQRRQGSVTTGSNIITLAQVSSFSTGDPVTGFGLPGGTTVSSVTGNQVTVNQNATASTTVSGVTGTIQSNFSQLVVSSAAGLAPGMTVTGSYLQPNTQITAVAGTALNLSAAVDPIQFLTTASTATGFSGIYDFFRPTNATNEIFFPFPAFFAPSISVGQYVSSSFLPLSRRARVVALKNVNVYRVAVLDTTYSYSRRGIGTTWTFYNVGSIPSATYNFTATNQTYTFRSDSAIPYGSYPGVGLYLA